MYFAILSSDANLVEAFDQQEEALAALRALVEHDPEHADEYAILQYDEHGQPVGDAILGVDQRTLA
jgi:hypothetical protein